MASRGKGPARGEESVGDTGEDVRVFEGQLDRRFSIEESAYQHLARDTEPAKPSGGAHGNASVVQNGGHVDVGMGRAMMWEIDPNAVLLEEFLGNGAYGAVYKGNWSGTEVAVKIVQEDLMYQGFESEVDFNEAMKVFWAEVKLMRTLAHPNVVQFIGACTLRHPRMLLMEYLPNGTLEDVFEEVHLKNKPLSFEVATRYALDIAKGMAYLHHNPQRTVIHRDVKPGNLLIDKSGTVKVADFGLSKAVDESLHRLKKGITPNPQKLNTRFGGGGTVPGNQPFEQRGYQVGTYIYMPAELFRSRSDYNSKVDVYSFAMILYELYEGQQPFAEYVANPMYAAAAAATGLRPEMNRTPAIVRSLISRCWAEKAKDRPTFLEILKELSFVDSLIRYDKSMRSRVTVIVHYCINVLLLALTVIAATFEYIYLGRARRDGDSLSREGVIAGLISKEARNAFDDPLVVAIQDMIPSVMVLASVMFVTFPNKKIRKITKRGPRYARRGGFWLLWRGCCGGALELLRRITLVSAMLSVAAIILQYEYEKYILDTLCNGDEEPFKPEKGIDEDLCMKNYVHSHYAMVVQAFLFGLNICQLTFNHCGLPEPTVTPGRFDTSLVAMKQKVESQIVQQSTSQSNSNGSDESTPLLNHPVTAREFYHIKKSSSNTDILASPV